MRLLLTIQYLGTRYAGWQTQANATGVQQVIEAALRRMCRAEVRLEAAGRTDSGVHAEGQRAHVDLPRAIRPDGLLLGLNTLLPSDIRIVTAEEVPETFHARFNAIDKSYEYRIWNGPIADVFHFETHAHVRKPLNERWMHQAAQGLVGLHDFRAYTVAEPEVASTWRTLSAIEVGREGSVVTIRAKADGFLRYMVRRMAGSLIEVGGGREEPGIVAGALEPHYGIARWTAPSKGLTLVRVGYGEPRSGGIT
jgi:tRNA pseudouridine38-40 synthase